MIKDILTNLSDNQSRQLMYAFEHEFSQFIRLPGNKFIGVNVKPLKNLSVEESAGKWAYGQIKEKKDG